jgi:hypothetical protein
LIFSYAAHAESRKSRTARIPVAAAIEPPHQGAMTATARRDSLLTRIKAALRRAAPGPAEAASRALFRLRHGWYGWGWLPLLWRVLPDRWVVAHQYRLRNGRWPDLRDPRGYNEKILWLKLHDVTPLHTRCADKIAVRDYVAERWGADILTPALLISHDVEDLRPEAVTAERFVVKTNHDQGGVFICRDRAAFDWAGVRRQIARRMRHSPYDNLRERQYKDIRPGIIVEQFLEADGPEGLVDYKFNCFGGRPRFVQVNIGRQGNHVQLFYDLDWRKLPCWRTYPDITPDAARPPNLARMVEIAAALSAPFAFARVDLYDLGHAIRFGEITFHPGGGLKLFHPPEWERRIGDMLDLPRP